MLQGDFSHPSWQALLSDGPLSRDHPGLHGVSSWWVHMQPQGFRGSAGENVLRDTWKEKYIQDDSGKGRNLKEEIIRHKAGQWTN